MESRAPLCGLRRGHLRRWLPGPPSRPRAESGVGAANGNLVEPPAVRAPHFRGSSLPRWRSRLLVAAMCLAGAAVGSLAIEPLFQRASPSIQDLDLSWQLSLGAALAQHLQFGPRYLFSYGPLGFLHVPMDYPTALLTRLAAAITVLFHIAYPIGMLLFANLVRRSTHLGRLGGGALLFATVLVALWTGPAADLGTLAELLSLVALAACLLRPNSEAVPLLACGSGVLLAFGALFKVDQLAVGVAQLAILTVIVCLLPGRRLRVPVLSWLGLLLGYLAFWLATGQHLSNLPTFWVGSWQISSGYSAAMSIASHWKPVAGIAGLALAGIGLPLAIRSWRPGSLTVQEAVIAMSVPWLFVSWKDGLVSIGGLDNGRAEALLGALLGVAWLVALLSPSLRLRWAVGPVATVCLCSVVLVAIFGPLEGSPWILSELAPVAAGPSAPQTPPDYIPPRLIATLRGHTVNVLPWDISLILDNHLRWDPVPEPQTYLAYTQYLDRIDTVQLASSDGASRLVVSLIDIYGRYLFWDPPAVWDTVISRYRCLATTGISAVLARRAPRIGTPRFLSQTTASFGEWVDVPTTALTYEFADVHISSSLEGEALTLALRQTPLLAKVRLSNGTVEGPLRLIAGTAGDGLYLSHFITTPQQFCGVLSGRASVASRIVAIQFTTPHPGEWSPPIRISFRGADAAR